jgi:hypothetical protein
MADVLLLYSSIEMQKCNKFNLPKIVNGDPNVLDNGLTAAAYFCRVR